jgi:hypothetical protein
MLCQQHSSTYKPYLSYIQNEFESPQLELVLFLCPKREINVPMTFRTIHSTDLEEFI